MTLVELLASMAILMFVVGAILGLLDTTAKIAPKDQERAHAVREVQVGLERMTRELRQAYRVIAWSPNSFEVEVRLPGDDERTTDVEQHSDWHVQYSCEKKSSDPSPRCTRYATRPGGQLPTTGTPVIERVQNTDSSLPVERRIFTVTTSSATGVASYVRVRLEVPAKGERTAGYESTIVLEDGFYLRNLR